MRRVFLVFVASGLLTIAILFGLLSLRSATPVAPGVAATIFPLYDLVRTVAEPETSVTLVLPPGASPHTFEVEPQRALDLAGVDTVFAIGHGLDGWAASVAAISHARVVTVDEGVALICEEGKEEGSCDPHYWMDARNAAAIVNTVRDTLVARDPDHADAYARRAEALKENLLALDSEIRATLADIEHPDLIVFHDSFSYFARAYGLNIRGVFEPSPGREPTPRQLQHLHETVSVYTVRTLYREPQLSENAVRAFARDEQVDIATLDPLGGGAETSTYADLLRFNANVLKQTLSP